MTVRLIAAIQLTMLVELHVRNFLLIDDLRLEWAPGFNVLTGETGAGKSVLVGALRLLLGGRATTAMVRPGARSAEIEALFDVSDSPDIKRMLKDSELLDGTELVIRRVIQAKSARSKAYINGRLSSVGELSRLASHLVDIASQHASVALTDPSTHAQYLDAYAGLSELRDRVAMLVARASAARQQARAAHEAMRTREEREQFLRFQLQTIDELEPRDGELDELRHERAKLRSSEELFEATSEASRLLVDSDESVHDLLELTVARLEKLVGVDDSLQGVLSMLISASNSVSEAGRELAYYVENVRSDPQRLSEVEERMFQLEKLLRVHGPTERDVLDARDRIVAELESLANAEDEVAELEQRFEQAMAEAISAARDLSSKRRKAAPRLGEKIGEQLAALGMGTARVIVEVGDKVVRDSDELQVDGGRLTKDGLDRVEFLIAPNKGMAAKPLAKIASGGELSRALLALKRVLASHGPAGTYVFDEVDTGVGGAVAERIGQALRDISKFRQVISITHLAPIASLADSHWLVSKSQEGEVALTSVSALTDEQRVQEVARMLSGAKVTRASLRTAAEMIGAKS